MLGVIPFGIPEEVVGQGLVRFGTLLKDPATGQIVKHLQETGLTQQVLQGAGVLPFSPLGALSAVSSVGANVQLVQLKRMVESLQMLQFVNLGATVAGIGVSAIGFALMNKKLNRLRDQVSSIGAQMHTRFDETRDRELRTHYSRIHGIFDQAEQARELSNPSPEWIRIASVMADESAYFRGEVRHLLQGSEFQPELFGAITSSYSLCNSGRIECLMLSNQLPAARKVAQDAATDYMGLFDQLNPIRLVQKMIASRSNQKDQNVQDIQRELEPIKDLVSNIREVQDAASSKPYLLDTLIARGVDGFEYMRRLREEKEQPILLLPAS